MSGALLDHGVVEALTLGRTVVVPTPQRATRLRHAWSRLRLAQGDEVWESPDILTWDSWLAREWQRGIDQSPVAGSLRRLNRAQERQLWTEALASLEGQFQDDTALRAHATALMRSAARARQWLIAAPRQALTEEERLLWLALARLDQACEEGAWRIIPLTSPDALQLQCDPPLIAGQAAATALQLKLAEDLWQGQSLLATVDAIPATEPRGIQASSPADEVRAAARWCRTQLARDASLRLLVISTRAATPLPQLGAEFWSALAAGTDAALAREPDPRVLVVEGGEPLLQHALIAQGIEALACLREPLELASFGRMLLSPYLAIGDSQGPALDLALRDLGRARLRSSELLQALQRLGTRIPAALSVVERLKEFSVALDAGTRRGATDWAVHFDQALRTLGFPGTRTPDSRDAQRLMRWRELLDEFASLDALGVELGFEEAWQQLLQLARHGVHEAASPDAAITLTTDRGDPLVRYDGIWVLGLTESAWPEPPRPDPFVPLAAQKRAAWPEVSVENRLQQAKEELTGWQRRTDQLMLSYAAFEGDLHQRPSRLLRQLGWYSSSDAADALVTAEAAPLVETRDEELPADAVMPQSLNAGLRSLQLQQDCPFRAQAEMRLGAAALESPSDSIDPRLRGQLLHKALEVLWKELADSASLNALTPAARDSLIIRSWRVAETQVLDRLTVPLDSRVRARERRRGEDVLAALLTLESARPAFSVVGIEARTEARFAGVDMRLRIDRIDQLEDASRLVIDYKASRLQSIALDDDAPRPLQLAVYAAALAARGEPVQAVALQSLAPGNLKLSGIGKAEAASASRIRATEDWDGDVSRWAREIERLAADFIGGVARVEPAAGVCRTCHLPAFCRIAVEGPDDE